MLNKLRQFMYGRYGNDALNLAFLVTGAVITMVLSLFLYRVPFVRYIGTVFYILAIIRALSKNHAARMKENEKFLRLIDPWKKFIMKKISQHRDKEHKYYACPQCHRTLRVPRGRGKIKISCPHCSKEFLRKT